MPSPTIRKAKLSDVSQIVKLEHACFNTDLFSVRQFSYLATKSKGVFLVVEHQDKLIGFAIILWREASDKARLYSIALDKKSRGTGLAIILLKKLESAARRQGCLRMGLEVHAKNSRAIQFYKKQGYTQVGMYKKYYQDGGDAWRMVKLL